MAARRLTRWRCSRPRQGPAEQLAKRAGETRTRLARDRAQSRGGREGGRSAGEAGRGPGRVSVAALAAVGPSHGGLVRSPPPPPRAPSIHQQA
jgi:hypothetical protein